MSDTDQPIQAKHVMAFDQDTSASTEQSTVVESNLGSTIYALSVKQVVRTGWHKGTWRLVFALLFTIILQMALIGLLWQVSSSWDPC